MAKQKLNEKETRDHGCPSLADGAVKFGNLLNNGQQ